MDHPSEPHSTTVPRSSTAPHSHLHRPHRHRNRHAPSRSTISTTVLGTQLRSPFDFESYNPLKRSHAPASAVNDDSSPAPPTLKPAATQAQVDSERSLRSSREADISGTLTTLDRLAHEATRRLDDTYYILLERLGTLKSTVAALEALHASMTSGREDFETQSSGLEKRARKELQEFQGFKGQEGEIGGLVTRLKEGRDKAGALEKRLEGVRARLEGWEEREKEAAKVRRRRWGVFWSVLAFVVAFVVAFLVWRGVNGREGEIAEYADEVKRTVEAVLGVERRQRNESLGIRVVGDDNARRKVEEHWHHVLDEL